MGVCLVADGHVGGVLLGYMLGGWTGLAGYRAVVAALFSNSFRLAPSRPVPWWLIALTTPGGVVRARSAVTYWSA